MAPALHPSARPRSDEGTASVRIAVLVARMSAAPIPWSARAAISTPNDGANPQSADPRVKPASPIVQIGVRPIMSESLPTLKSKAAITTR